MKYCPIMSYHYQDSSRKQCLGEECAWADKNGNCLIAKALTQITDPISTLVPGYPPNQDILHGQPIYKTNWVWKDTTTSPAIDLPYSPSANTSIDYPYRPIKLKMQGEEADEGWGGF